MMGTTYARGAKWGFSRQPLVGLTVLLLALALAVSQAVAAAPASSATGSEMSRVIIRAVPGAVEAVRATVERTGGVVTRDLGIINGFAAKVPASAAGSLETVPGVAAVSADYELRPHTTTSAGDLSATELGSLYNTARTIGATDMWRHGYTGKGVDVAVIDTGIVPVDGLLWDGKVLHGPDLSFESQDDELRHLDTYGHGTAMSSIIAGRDLAVADPVTNLGAGFQGIAPDARILSMKVGAATGAVDVSQVIAAFDWVVQNGQDHGLNVRVINLAYGTDSVQSPSVDPLAYAADVAWRKGIVVVASAGNDGRGTTLAMPAQNPNIIAVGATDHNGTVDHTDDKMASFSTYANGIRRPDFVAPGVGLVGLRSPGSYLDTEHPQAVRAERFFRGSGTSQAAAVTSGAVALLLEQRPELTPDQVKRLIRSTAFSLRGTSNNAQGAGLLNLRAARTAATPTSTQTIASLTGTGLLDGARGTSYVVADGVELRGEQDIFGNAWDGSAWAEASWNESSWDGVRWNGADWTGVRWNMVEMDGAQWDGVRWNGVRWNGVRWNGVRWNGTDWTGTEWAGVRWNDADWDGVRWNDDGWDGVRWNGVRWNGVRWNQLNEDGSWSGVRWNGVRWNGVRWNGVRWNTTWSGAGWE